MQYAIKGTSIVFGNGKVGQAMMSFPPEPGMLKDTFVAVFAGAEEEDGRSAVGDGTAGEGVGGHALGGCSTGG